MIPCKDKPCTVACMHVHEQNDACTIVSKSRYEGKSCEGLTWLLARAAPRSEEPLYLGKATCNKKHQVKGSSTVMSTIDNIVHATIYCFTVRVSIQASENKYQKYFLTQRKLCVTTRLPKNIPRPSHARNHMPDDFAVTNGFLVMADGKAPPSCLIRCNGLQELNRKPCMCDLVV